MVFESIVADLLNRFLGDFVDNLDSSQLNIGIWGGDVKLENLEVKETALDDLDLPVKLKYGYLSSLVLKIPWKNLYNEPVIATIDGLNLIVVPNKGVVYNEEKAKKNMADIKQKTLTRLEEARKNRRKPPDPVADSFAEKMVTQIIKNLQVSVSNIHVRFEDKYTNRHRPFVAGVTLEKLDFQTTDDNWLPTIHRDVVKIIHKLVSLDNLAVYWNSDSKLYSDLTDKAEIKKKLQETITNGKNKPIGFKYILEPIKMEAKLQLNQKPETDGSNWSIPKIDLSVDMQTLALMIAKFQYQDILLFLEAQERFTLAGQYLKYRPHLNEYKGQYKKWWKFAYTCILEEKVRRRRNNWSWERVKKHRQLVRDYKEAWVKHQTEKSPSASVTELIKKAEEVLDVFNVNVARQQAEMEIDRKGMTRLEDQPQGWMAWGKSWFGGAGAPPEDGKKSGKDILNQFNEAMTPEEKAKLFEAIDYQENIPPTNYPKEFVENKIQFRLGQVAIVVDGAVSMQLLHLKANIEQRPSAGAINVKSGIKELRMDGCGAEMLRVRDPSQPWLDMEFDTNPLHGKWDQFVKLNIAPVTLKYHAPAVNNAADVFKPPESVKLNQLTAAAMSRYEEVKTRSVTGLAHAVENKTKTILDIKINPATLLISEGGVYDAGKPTVIADLGLLSITTVDSKTEKEMSGMNKMARLREQAYDRFRVKLSNVVIAMAENVDKAKASIAQAESPNHILKPTGLDIQLHKSGIDDLSLPKMRVIGDLPDIIVSISDVRLLMLLKLLASIPKPKPEAEIIIEDAPPVQPEFKAKDRAKMRTIMEVEEVETAETVEEEKKDEKKSSEQQVQIELDLKLNTIGFVVYRGDDVLADVKMQRFVCQLQMRTFDMVVRAELGAVSFGMPMFKALDAANEYLYLINNNEDEGALMKLKFVQANPESPFFATEYQKTEQAVDFKFSKLNVAMHQQGLMELKKFGEDLQSKMAELNKEQMDSVEKAVEDTGRKLSRKLSGSMESLALLAREHSEAAAAAKKRREKKKEEEPDPTVIKMRIDASIGQLAVLIGNNAGLDTVMAIENVRSEVRMTLKAMDVTATLQAITMRDMTPKALYKDLLAVHGNREMLRFEMTQYNRTDAEKKKMQSSDVDMKVKVRLAQMRFVFLNLWLVRLMAWLAPFQEEAAKAAAHAQAMAAEKSAEALEAAKQMLEQSPPRIELDVELLAPLLLLPRLSTSVDVLIFDLGNLTVRNKITGDRLHQKAVMDRMDIKMTDVNFGIGKMDDAVKSVATKCEILKPLTFSIAVHRNLTFGIVKDIPEIACDAHIPSIECAMSQDDYSTLMQTLSGNLAEGQGLAPPPAPTVQAVASAKKDEDRVANADDKEQKKTVSTSESKKLVVDVAKPRIVFQFALDHIGAVLYTGASTVGVRDASTAFAAMHLEGLKLSGSIKEDNAMQVAMSLKAFTMNDERKDKTKINKLMDKKEGHEGERFLDLAFTQNAKQDKNVKIKMSAFFLCLCPEFLGCLSSFFTVPKTEEQLEKEAEPTAVKGSGAVQQTSQGTTVATTEPAAPPGAMTMDCDMQGIEVILVENSLHPEDTQALILSFNIKLVAEPRATEQVMHGGIEKLRVFSSYYALERRKDVTYEVLKAVDIGIALKIDNETKATDVILKMTPMELKMSPSVIRLLSAVNSEFAKSTVAVEASSTSSAPRRRLFPDYWSKKTIEEHKFWFFKVPVAEEALEDDDDEESHTGSWREVPKAPIENCTVDMPRLSFTLEAGNEEVPVPLILFDMRMTAEAHNWSSSLKAVTDVSLQMSYYNEDCSVWEPVIEPNEVAEGQWERWNLKMTVEGRNKLDKDDCRPAMEVKIDAQKMLNVTVTKSFLALLTKLGEVFEAAAKQTTPPQCRQLPGLAPYIIYNDTGMTVKVANSDSLKVSDDGSAIDATHGAFVDLDVIFEHEKKERVDEILSAQQEETKAVLRLELLDTVREVTLCRAENSLIPLPKHSDGGKQWKVVCDVAMENNRRLVTLRSLVQVTNHLDVDMEIYSKRDTSLDLAGVVKANETVNLPVPLLYTPTGELFFKPTNDRCEVSFESVSWHDFAHQKRATVRCNLSEDDSKGYFFETVIHQESVDEGHGHAPSYEVHLWPPLVFHNNLPFPIQVHQPTEIALAPGEDSVLNVISGQKLKVTTQYNGENYTLDMKLDDNSDDLQVVALNTDTGSSELLLGMHWSREHGGLKGYLYAPFWLVNNSSLNLRHMESSNSFIASSTKCVPCRKNQPTDEENEFALRHDTTHNPIILPFPSTDVGQKKKSRVQIENESGWSDEFPLDTVGNAGRVTCKGPDRDYELTVSIQLCQSGLTKIVTFAPFYLVSNCGKFDLEVREDGFQQWINVPAETCIGIWPAQRSKRKLMCARFSDATEESLLFPITENIETLTQINDDSVGFDVATTVGESSATIHLVPFQAGSAPLHIINHLKLPLEYGQKGQPHQTLAPNEHVFFTWSDISGDRTFEFSIGDYKGESKLDQNKFGELQPNKNVRKFVYFSNFLNGRQRTLLFEEDLTIARTAFGSWESDLLDMSCELRLQGIGLSMVDNHKGLEVLFIGISSSDILWEEEVKKGRFKPLAVKYMEGLEEKYQEYVTDKNDHWQPLDKYEVNMHNMLLKKKNKEMKLRRIFEKGIWAQYGKSAQRTRMHFKLNHLQIDNQLDACVFPCVLSVVPPPKSVIQDNAPKPFVELSFLQRNSEHSTIPEIEYCKVLVQEFAVRVDQGLINAMLTLVANQTSNKPYSKEEFDADLKLTEVKLSDMADTWKSKKPKSFYDILHVSPLMIHLSFSQGGTAGEEGGAIPIQSEFINVLLKSVGVSLTELQDVVFKLAYFERCCVFYSQEQLNSEIISHYTKQAIKQLYVLVLGLDIIGNPFGLVRDLSAGVEDLFYQPFQGAIQGPEEFAAGMALGVQSLFGHAVGGAAGAVGRITGTVGKGVAALTFDQDYQRKRQEDLNRRPQTFAEGMARGFKGLGMGVVDGVTGVVTKPIEGARQEGFGGFFKGAGKGLVGVVTRPISGVVDFASSSMNAVRTVAGTHKEAGPVRPPRLIKTDHIVRPYSAAAALGYKIFKDTDRGALTETDEFITYAPISEKVVLLVTNRQIVIAKRTDVMGTWTADWQAEYTKIHEPQFVATGIKIRLLEKKKGFLGIGSSEGKIITFNNAQGIQQKILASYRNAIV